MAPVASTGQRSTTINWASATLRWSCVDSATGSHRSTGKSRSTSPPRAQERGGAGDSCGGVSAIARDSSGDLLGLTKGGIKIGEGNRLGLQLYALKAAGNLAKKLRDDGKDDGPVVYESSLTMVTACLHKNCYDDAEKVMESFMPDDLEEVVTGSCVTLDEDRLRMLPREMLRLIEQDKINAVECRSTGGFVFIMRGAAIS